MDSALDYSFVAEWQSLEPILLPFLIRCGIAAVCGGLVGLERELKHKPAGFRTNILICVGSAMYMAVGLLLVPESREGYLDPTRIAAQVVTGIGFLGAGCIIQQRGRITGLTTAATIWVVAAIGMVAGAGFPILAMMSALLVLTTLTVLGVVEDRLIHSPTDDSQEAGVADQNRES